MSRSGPIVSPGIRVDELSIFRDEKSCRLWIECLERSLHQARGYLEEILLQKAGWAENGGDREGCSFDEHLK